jgi:hypothetical protein
MKGHQTACGAGVLSDACWLNGDCHNLAKGCRLDHLLFWCVYCKFLAVSGCLLGL